MRLTRSIGRIFVVLAATAAVAAVSAPATAAPSPDAVPTGITGVSKVVSFSDLARVQKPTSVRDVGVMVDKDGICELGEACLIFNADFTGSFTDYFFSDANLNDDVFLTAGVGQGQPVGNNFRSMINTDPTLRVVICDLINFGGGCALIPANTAVFNIPPVFESLVFVI